MTQRRAVRKFVIASICLGLSGCFETEPSGSAADADALAASAGKGGDKGDNGNKGGKAGASSAPGVPAVSDADAGGPGLPECDADAAVDGPPQLEAHTILLWPPNHKFHEISVSDCVTLVDACDRDLHPEFIWASSDEPIDDLGDGHHAPDIQLSDDCQVLAVRSERQGPEDGRVYTLGVRVVDRDGNASEAECEVAIVHDQSGVPAADSGEKYRITFDGAAGGPSCDGEPPPPPPTPPMTPPGNPPNDPPGMDNPPAVPDAASPS